MKIYLFCSIYVIQNMLILKKSRQHLSFSCKIDQFLIFPEKTLNNVNYISPKEDMFRTSMTIQCCFDYLQGRKFRGFRGFCLKPRNFTKSPIREIKLPRNFKKLMNREIKFPRKFSKSVNWKVFEQDPRLI